MEISKKHRLGLRAAIGMLCALFMLNSCLDKEYTTVETSDNATVLSLTFDENDSIPHLDEAEFIIDNDNNLIYNKDSLPYQTRIDSVFPSFTFASTAGAALIVDGDTVYLTGNDTVDFTVQPVKLINYASDGIHFKEYDIYVNVHQVEPELFVWTQLCEAVYQHEGSSQKALQKDGAFYVLVSSGLKNYLYVSEDASQWQAHAVEGLPQNMDFRQALVFNGKFYVASEGKLYASDDASVWNETSHSDYEFVNLLYVFNDELWAVVRNVQTGAITFAGSRDAQIWMEGVALPEKFPISDYAAFTFESRTGKAKAMVMGGITAEGVVCNTRWCTEDGSLWVDYSVEQPEFGSLSGAAVVYYADRLLMFGGVDANNQLFEGPILESYDEGLHWAAPDTTLNKLPETFAVRTNQSAFVYGTSIYLFGGRTRTQVFSDMWKGKLNKMDFSQQ